MRNGAKAAVRSSSAATDVGDPRLGRMSLTYQPHRIPEVATDLCASYLRCLTVRQHSTKRITPLNHRVTDKPDAFNHGMHDSARERPIVRHFLPDEESNAVAPDVIALGGSTGFAIVQCDQFTQCVTGTVHGELPTLSRRTG